MVHTCSDNARDGCAGCQGRLACSHSTPNGPCPCRLLCQLQWACSTYVRSSGARHGLARTIIAIPCLLWLHCNGSTSFQPKEGSVCSSLALVPVCELHHRPASTLWQSGVSPSTTLLAFSGICECKSHFGRLHRLVVSCLQSSFPTAT
jgi:hypothetical protein